MLFSSVQALLAIAAVVAASPTPDSTDLGLPTSLQPYTSEYQSLGCPSTTSEFALFPQQIAAFDDFTQLLFVQKNISEAVNKYYAKDVINHAQEVSQNGSTAAAAYLESQLPYVQTKLEGDWIGYDSKLTTYGTQEVLLTTPNHEQINLVNTYRLIGTCIVEIWVAEDPVTSSPNPIYPYSP